MGEKGFHRKLQIVTKEMINSQLALIRRNEIEGILTL